MGQRDRSKLEEYFNSLRDLEIRLQQNEEWVRLPKPTVGVNEPKDVTDQNDVLARQRMMYEMMVLALQTDSTRVITFDLGSLNAVPSNIQGVNNDWHHLCRDAKD